MSYHYSSYQKTTTTANGVTTTTTRTSSSDLPTLVVREITDSEASKLPMLNTSSTYEISDDDRLTPFDFHSLLDPEEEESSADCSSDSDVEYHWFPSLLKRSVIEFLDDVEGEDYMDQDFNVIVIENDDSSEEDESIIKHGSKRLFGRQPKKLNKRPRKSDLVPVEVVHVVL